MLMDIRFRMILRNISYCWKEDPVEIYPEPEREELDGTVLDVFSDLPAINAMRVI